MKKVVTLSAILAMSLTSLVYAADNTPVPPPKYPATQDGQPPRHDNKNPQHLRERTNKDGKTWKHDGKSSNHDNKEWKQDDSMRNHDGKRPPRDGKKSPLPEEKR